MMLFHNNLHCPFLLLSILFQLLLTSSFFHWAIICLWLNLLTSSICQSWSKNQWFLLLFTKDDPSWYGMFGYSCASHELFCARYNILLLSQGFLISAYLYHTFNHQGWASFISQIRGLVCVIFSYLPQVFLFILQGVLFSSSF